MATVRMIQQSRNQWMVSVDGTVVGSIFKANKEYESIRHSDGTSLGIYSDRYRAMEAFVKVPAAPKQPAICSHPDYGTIGYACRLLDCPVHGERNRVMVEGEK